MPGEAPAFCSQRGRLGQDPRAIRPRDLTNQQRLPPEALKAATTLITIGPIILLYPFLQRYFIKGIFIGSLKG